MFVGHFFGEPISMTGKVTGFNKESRIFSPEKGRIADTAEFRHQKPPDFILGLDGGNPAHRSWALEPVERADSGLGSCAKHQPLTADAPQDKLPLGFGGPASNLIPQREFAR